MDGARANQAVKLLLAPVEAGAAVSVFLLGVATLQTYAYYSRFPTDRWTIKYLVATVYLMELGQVVAILQYIYTVSVDWYGRPDKYMIKAPPGLYIEVFLGGAISGLVQSYLALRAGRFAGSMYITAIFWLLVLTGFIFATAVAVVVYMYTLKEFVGEWSWLVSVGKTVSTTVDVFVAVLLCFTLYRERTQVLKRTTRVLDRLILISFQTGLLTSLLSIAVMVSFIAANRSFVWVGLFMCLGGLHSNSLLVTLNARSELRQLDHGTATTTGLPSSDSSAPVAFARPTTMTQIPMEIGVHSQRSAPHGGISFASSSV